MSSPENALALSTSLSLKDFGECVDVARSVNELSFRLPGMLWRAEWEEALESLAVIDPNGVLDKVLSTFAARRAFLGSWTMTSNPTPDAEFEVTEHKRFTVDDLNNLKDLLVRTDRASVQALVYSSAHNERMACDLLERAIPYLVLATDLSKHERYKLRSWLQTGRGLHGISAAMSNQDFVQRIFETLDNGTFAHRGWPPQWRRLMLVNRTWREAVQALGHYTALPPDAAPNLVDAALRQLPSTKMLICTLTHLSITGTQGLTSFLDLLRGANALSILRITGWIQCEAELDIEQLDVVTLPRVRSFEYVGSGDPRRMHGMSATPTVSLIRYLRLPVVEYFAISEPVESAGEVAEQEKTHALASHLAAIAAALSGTSPCIQGTKQFTIASDTRDYGLVLRTRRFQNYIQGETLVPPLSVHIYMIPPSHPDARLSHDPIALHLFIRLCQALAPLVPLAGGTATVLPLNSLAAIDIAAVSMPQGFEGPRFLPHRPPWKKQYHNHRKIEDLPIYNWAIHTLTQPARIVLFLSNTARNDALFLPIQSLDTRQLERSNPHMPSTILCQEPAIEHIELDAHLTSQFMQRNMLQSSDFHDILRVRATRGLRIRAIFFTGGSTRYLLPIHPLQTAARGWGDVVGVQTRNSANGTYCGKTLVFEPLR